MKILSVGINRRKRAFEIAVRGKTFVFPFSRCDPAPAAADSVERVFVDSELGNEGFTYVLRSGREGSIHIERVLDYNRDPAYLRDLLVYRLTLEARERLKISTLSRREIIRRLGTSAAQFYRLLDPTNTSKSIDQLVRLLGVLDCEVRLVVEARSA